MNLEALPITRRGLTDFTFSRWLVPWLCNYEGTAVFMDSDIVVTGDIGELFDYADSASFDAQVQKDQPKFEWPSVILFNNACCRALTPEYVGNTDENPYLWEWCKSLGEFPEEWNHCVGYTDPKPANLYHYTQGIPYWDECGGLPEDRHWFEAYSSMLNCVSWSEMMGRSVHFKPVIRRMMGRYGVNIQDAK